MIYRLTEFLPAFIIVFMIKVSRKAKLKPAEEKVQKEYIARLGFGREKGGARLGKIVGIVGLTGSGKSAVACALVSELPGIIVEGDVVRVMLREAGASYDRAWKICENAAIAAAGSGRHVVLDADYFAAEKRASLRKAAEGIGAETVFVRTICHPEMMDYRLSVADYRKDAFFPHAKPTCKELAALWDTLDVNIRGALIKRKEMLARFSSHYRPVRTKYPGRYQWKQRKFSFVDFEIDTTDEKKWPQDAKKNRKTNSIAITNRRAKARQFLFSQW